MNVDAYLKSRQSQLEQAPQYRTHCKTCVQPQFSCYCPHIQTFEPRIEFAILIHPIEVRRRVATGRMSHLVLKDSHLIAGQNFTQDEKVNAILKNPRNQCVILYPGKQSIDLSKLPVHERGNFVRPDKKLVLFVIDGTWATARKMVRLSENLKDLPRICFTPERPSQFRVRKQPRANYLSTIEAIHSVIELIGPAVGFEVESREHDKLLNVFDKMVERQLFFIERGRKNPEFCRYHRAKQTAHKRATLTK